MERRREGIGGGERSRGRLEEGGREVHRKEEGLGRREVQRKVPEEG